MAESSLDKQNPAQMTEKEIIDFILACKAEAKEAKTKRMRLNRANMRAYHLDHDFSHKMAGQSVENLAKQPMAVEQIKSFFQQALSDVTDWWKCEAKSDKMAEKLLIRPEEIQKLMNHQLQESKFYAHVGNAMQTALLNSLIISKEGGKLVAKPKYTVREEGKGKDLRKKVLMSDDVTWCSHQEIVRAEDFYPDPTGKGLYQIEDMHLDLHEVRKASLGSDAIYESGKVAEIKGGTTDAEQRTRMQAETNQNDAPESHRPKVTVTEFYGNILNKAGDVVYENVTAAIANDKTLIRKPTENQNWHQRSNYIVAPLIEVAGAVWPKALMDSPTQINGALTELFNLVLDAAFKSVHATTQLRVSALEDSTQVSNGVKAGTTLLVNENLPPGAKVMEPVDTADVPNDAITILNLLQQEFNAAALTNDLRQGVMPFRQVKATEIVEASQSITSMFQGMAKNVEEHFILPTLVLKWQIIAQNLDLIDKEELVSLFGEERGTEIHQMDPEDIFASTVNGVRFAVFGVTQRLAKAQNYQKLTTLLQTVSASEPLLEAFMKKYSVDKFLGEVMTSLDIDKTKLELDEVAQARNANAKAGIEQEEQGEGETDQLGVNPQALSQVQSPQNAVLADLFAGPQFPGSPATAGQGAQ